MNKKNTLKDMVEKANASETNKAYFSAAIQYKDALTLAVKLQSSETIKLCKEKLVKMNKMSIESGDFGEHEFDYKLTKKQISLTKKIIVTILKIKGKQKALRTIGLHPFFMPRVSEIEKTASDNTPIFYQFGNLTSISDEGHAIRGGSIAKYSWFMQMYDLYQKQIIVLYLNKLFYMLMYMNSYGTNMGVEDLSDYFINSKLFNKGRQKIITNGLQHYYKKDYIACLHILIPQFESFIIDIVRGFGVSKIALDDKMDTATRTSVLSDRDFDSEEFQKIFGVDFCTQVKFVLFEPLGYKLRHKIAHGEISESECNFQNATLIVYLYLYLLARIKVKSS